MSSFREYFQLIASGMEPGELQLAIDLLTTNETYFFREEKHFEFIRDRILSGPKPAAPFRVWSAACSSGEEAYSTAIVLAEFFNQPSSLSWKIECSDISTRILERAQKAVYLNERVANVPADIQRNYFQSGTGDWTGYVRVKESLRKNVQFHHLNLFDTPYPFQHLFHIIFCRNVMIYFDRPTQESLVNRLADHLHPGGYLFVGHSESLSGIRHPLKTCAPATYQKSPLPV
jgi:chemotaxis protein methyltransferase CheR